MRLGSVLGVVAAAALAGVAAAGPALYVSSSATAAVHEQAAGQCGADLGVRVAAPPDGPATPALDAAAARLAHTLAPVVTVTYGPTAFSVVGGDAARRTLTLVSRPGQERAVGAAAATIAPGDALLPDWEVALLGLSVGDQLDVQVARDAASPRLRLRYAGSYPTVPTQPVSSYWCGFVTLFKPDAKGDYPPPVALVAPETLAPVLQPWTATRWWELRPDGDALTRDGARSLAAAFDRLAATHLTSDTRLALLPTRVASKPQRLGALVDRAEQVASTVSKTVGPVAFAGFVATGAVLVAAGLLVARARRRELRLLGVRGVAPARIWLRLAGALAGPVAGGAALGFAVTLATVRAFGPSPLFETRIVARSAAATALAAALALVVLVGVAHAAGRRLVDAPERARGAWRRRVPWELVPVAAAVVSYRRLSRVGGVELAGAKAYGGDVLAQAYPLLLLVAVLAALARPVAFAVRRARFVGRRWRPSLQLGVRRVVAEPGVSVGLLLATALAVASLVSARVLTDSAVRALDDKARTYVGSDLAVATNAPVVGLPPADAARTTSVVRQDVRAGDLAVQLLGVDPDTFGQAASWRGDEASTSLAGVLGRLRAPAVGGALPALLVGGRLGTTELVGPAGARLAVAPVATLATFPGFRNPGPIVVVDAAALARSGMSTRFELWWRAPPADAEARVRATGVTVYGSTGTATVFDTTSFLAVRWSYALLAAFGVVIAAVTALAQLLVLDARRRARQAAYVLTGRMGLGRRHQFVSLLAEVGLPIAVGALVGFGLGAVAARTSVARLDTLRNLQPRTVAVVAVTPGLAVLAATLAVALALAAWGLAAVVRTDPMEVLRETA